jgi:magnesium transporter
MEISQRFNVDIADLEDSLEESERPRYNFDLILNNNFLLLQIPHSEELNINQAQATFPLGIIITQSKKLITIQSLATPGFENIIETIIRRKILDYFFLTIDIFHNLVKQMDKIAEKIVLNIREIQKNIIGFRNISDIQKPFFLNSYLIFYNTAMLGNMNAMKSFYNKNKSLIDSNIPLFDKYSDMVNDMEQVYSLTSIYRDVLSNALDAYASVINNNMTQVMKIVASISLILMIPTLIASFFGMNVYFPLISPNEPNIIPLILILLVSTLPTGLIWWYFRKLNWL